MNFKKILIYVFFIVFNIALNAGLFNWARSWLGLEKSDSAIQVHAIPLFTENKTNYLHSAGQILNTENLKIDNTRRAQAILYIYLILHENVELNSDLFNIEEVKQAIGNSETTTISNDSFKKSIQDAIKTYIDRKQTAIANNSVDASNLSDANVALNNVEASVIAHLSNAIVDELINLATSLSILDENN